MPELLSHWSQVNWIKANKEVKRLRKRIFQAKKDGNFRKLRNLQRLMLKSSSNILLSIRDVTSNSGKNTAGIDGKKFSDHREKLNLFYEIKNNGYMGKEPMPCKRIYIQEPTKKRPIGIPTIYDRIIQTTVKNSLEPEWETIFEKGSYGFRPGRNVDDAVFRVWNTLNRSGGKKWIVDSDISKCFDSISHKYILEQIKQFAGYKIIEKWLKVGIIFKGVWLGSGEDGTPQGSAISPLLCNISLHGLEEELGVKYTKKGYIQMTSRCLIRFADDLVIICRSKEDALLALEDLKIALKKRGLEISDSKTSSFRIRIYFKGRG
jgi:RNA-directed DNA polymerase